MPSDTLKLKKETTMKKILIATLIAAFSMPSFAGGIDKDTRDAALDTVQQQQQQNAVSGSNSTSAGVSTNVNNINMPAAPAHTTQDVNYNTSGTTTVKMAPPVSAPALTSSNDTCMGSSSFGASGVGFGISIGSSWTDANCIMLKNAREMFNMGMPDVAFARLCMDALNKEAIELTGRVCPQTAKAAAK